MQAWKQKPACPSLLLQCDVQGRVADEWIREKCRAFELDFQVQKNSTLICNVQEDVNMFYVSALSRSMTNGWQLQLNFCSI